MKVRQATVADAPQIAAIYNHYIANTTVTFEEEPVGVAEMEGRIVEVGSFPWLVCEVDGKIAGYAYAGSWKSRCAYRFSVEISVYLRDGLSGKGIGTALYTELFSKLRAMKLHSVIGGMALPNDASIALHEKFGFEKIAHFREVGFKFGKWIDVVYYQKIL
jgi:L-amino acid N-acyltransferase YncA